MLEVLRIGLTKEHLEKMSIQERGLLLLLGYASNQVNVLWKLIIGCLNRDPTDPVDAKVSAAQAQVLVRLLIGVLREQWGLVERRGAVRKVVGIRRGAISDNMRVSFQAARSIG